MSDRPWPVAVSVVVPCYNAVGKMDSCLESLERQTLNPDLFEVILVDDCSDDGSFEALREVVHGRPNWSAVRLDVNSGSPSRPRNVGTTLARGEYVLFLDIDDSLPREALQRVLEHARSTGACLVRGYLLVADDDRLEERNRIEPFDQALGKGERVAQLIGRQSTNPTQLVRKSVIVDNDIEWPESVRMGEDTIFLLKVLLAAEVVEYVDGPILIYSRHQHGRPSSTQQYGNRELRDHLFVWAEAARLLGEIDLDYAELRLRTALDSALTLLIRFGYEDISQGLFDDLSALARAHRAILESTAHWERLSGLYSALYARDYLKFLVHAKKRLLVAGMDLKFIRAAVPHLEHRYEVAMDEWPGPNNHVAQESERLLNWADVILCEWALGNAVWYSQRKKPHQRLVVRYHRFELSTQFPAQIKVDNVDAVIAVSVHFVEALLDRTDWPRSKVRHVPNFLLTDEYQSVDIPDRAFHLAMVGVVPARKGLHRAVELLARLRELDDRYTLRIYGKGPDEFPWILRDPEEMAYYKACQDLVADQGLEDHLSWEGWVDVRTHLADVGFVLSLSDPASTTPHSLPESFHLAPADGFLAGGIGLLLDWDGVEYVYPAEYVFPTVADMIAYILDHRDLESFMKSREIGAQFIRDNYSVDAFVERFDRVVSGLR